MGLRGEKGKRTSYCNKRYNLISPEGRKRGKRVLDFQMSKLSPRSKGGGKGGKNTHYCKRGAPYTIGRGGRSAYL